MKLLNKKTGIIGVCLMAAGTVILSGCKTFSGTDTSNQEIEARDYEAFMKHTADVYKNYVTLGEYKGLKTTAVDRSSENISDSAVDGAIQELISKSKKTEDITNGGTTASGDQIVLNYTGTIDGQPFDGGTASDQTYTIGSGQYISDLDKGLVGLQANKDYDIPVKFPDDYSNEALKGKNAVFKVHITKITRTTTPEANDEWVKDNRKMFKNFGYGEPENIGELKNNIKEFMAKQAKQNNDIAEFETVYNQILEKTEIKGYPEEEKNALENTYKENIKSQYEQYGSSYGVQSYDDYIQKVYGKNEEEFSKYVQDTTETYLKQKMIVTLIARENNIKVSTEDITFLGGTLAAYYGFDDFNALIKQYGKKINCELGYQSLYSKVASYVISTSDRGDSNESEGQTTENNANESTQAVETTGTTETTEATETTETTGN